jgi:hypothetical protein
MGNNFFSRVAFAFFLALSPLSASHFDGLVLLGMPAKAAPGATLTLGAVDLINDLSPAASPADSLVRDSIHFGLGLPAGWSVISVTVHPSFDFRPSRASVNNLDTNYRNQLLLDSLEANAGKGIALVSDTGLKAYVKGRTYRGVHASPDSLGMPIVVKADTVSQWFGFSGPLALSIPAGQPADTIFETNPKSALKQIPVFIYAVIKAGNQEESVKPLFLAKSGPLDTAAYSNSADLDRASVVYRPVAVGTPVSLPPIAKGSAGPSRSALRDPLGRAPRGRGLPSAVFYPIGKGAEAPPPEASPAAP